MEIELKEIARIEKVKPSAQIVAPKASSCCTPKNDAPVCCTPSESATDNEGACCAQPEDGSSCCDK